MILPCRAICHGRSLMGNAQFGITLSRKEVDGIDAFLHRATGNSSLRSCVPSCLRPRTTRQGRSWISPSSAVVLKCQLFEHTG